MLVYQHYDTSPKGVVNNIVAKIRNIGISLKMRGFNHTVSYYVRKILNATIFKYFTTVPEKYVHISSNEKANALIKETLLRSQPAMITRFGSIEFSVMFNYHLMKQDYSFFKKFYLSQIHSRGASPSSFLDEEFVAAFHLFAGFFPNTQENIVKFYSLMMEDIKYIDVLACWNEYEDFFNSFYPNAKLMKLAHLLSVPTEVNPNKDSWTSELKGKKVLVIHPFEKSIKSQYKKRTKLFSNPDFLPKFDLITLKAVQSIAGNPTEFKDWFEALDSMKQKIDQIDFDIALIAAGAYGLPLAAHIKRQGKIAIHIGGALQLAFGIMGKRWKKGYNIKTNQHWVKPLKEETPSDCKKIMDSYW